MHVVQPIVLLAIAALVVGCGSETRLSTANRPGVDPEEETVPDAPPAGTAGLEGVVCAPDGETVVSHAKVTVQHATGEVQATTDGDGAFRLDGLPAGPAQVEVAKGSFRTTRYVELVEGEVASLAVDDDDACTPVEQGTTRIAVVTGEYDRIEQILDQLHLDYDVIEGVRGAAYVDFLRDPAALAAYDVIFFNCGMGLDWIPHDDEVGANLRAYVAAGGSIYASDWAYYLVESGWPAEHDWFGPDTNAVDALVGDTQQILADVRDPAMAAVLGADQAELRYDLSGWAAMEGASGEVLIEGTYRYWDFFSQGERRAPLATRLHDGDGSVLYTSFHNEGQNTHDMLLLLQEIILSL